MVSACIIVAVNETAMKQIRGVARIGILLERGIGTHLD
jgi:hypothetical protein